jgi:sugar lactone lactonase YvrE
VYVGDLTNNRIRKISPGGVVSTLAGSGKQGVADGVGTEASFKGPVGLVVDADGNIYVADTYNHLIRKITASGIVTTLAGSGKPLFADGDGVAASFHRPHGVALDKNKNVLVADTDNNRIRKITPSGVVTTLAGSETAGYADGQGTAAQFKTPSGIAVDGFGNIYVADNGNNRIRKITPRGVVTTLAGSETAGNADGQGTAAQFKTPTSLSVDSFGNIYVADNGNQRIRKITPSGTVTTLAGSGNKGADDGYGTAASFKAPWGIAVDATGACYVADQENQKIRKIFP